MLKQKKKSLVLLLCCLLLPFTLTGCIKYGELDEGECKCIISFTDIPKEFTILEENLQRKFEIEVCLQNPVNEKKYIVLLNQDNDYTAEISLHSGTYQVYYVSNNMAAYNNISVGANVSEVELSPDNTAEILIAVDNPEEFSQHWMATQPMPEIRLADQFSRQIQINRKVINIADILPELTIENNTNTQVGRYQKVTLTDTERGVEVTLLNNSDNVASWTECDVVGIRVYKNNAVFPEGVTLGMLAENVVHKTDGLYGEPDACAGSLLFSWEFENTKLIYNDPESGDRMTICLNPSCTYITEISYEFALYD